MDVSDIVRGAYGHFGWSSSCVALGAVWVAHWGTQHAQRMYGQYGKVIARCGLTGQAAAKRLLAASGLSHLKVIRTSRPDQYHAGRHEIQLNSNSFDSNSLAALATAAHEVGHAQQHASGYVPCRLRRMFWPVCSGITVACVILLLMGFTVMPLHQAGMLICGLCLASLLMQLPVVLPMEYDASRRAMAIVTDTGIVTTQEMPAFKRLLKAAGLTYVAAEARRWLVLLVLAVMTFWVLPDVAIEADSDGVLLTDNMPDVPDTPVVDLMPDVVATIAEFLLLAALGVVTWFFFKKKASRLPPSGDRAVELSNAGMALHAEGQFDEALDKLDRAIELDSDLAVAWHNRGMVRLSLGQYDDAMVDFDHALMIMPDMCEALVGRGEVWSCRLEWDRALVEYDTALCMYPAHAHALTGRGRVWLAREQYGRAIEDYSLALQHGADETTVSCERGQAHLFNGDTKRAIADFDRAIALGVRESTVFNNRGVALMRCGDYTRAMHDLEEARQISPELPNPYRHLAWMQATCSEDAVRDGQAAVNNARRAIELSSGGHVEWQSVLAAAYAEAGNFAEAVRCQTQCIEAGGIDMADALQEQLEHYRARRPWREAIGVNSESGGDDAAVGQVLQDPVPTSTP